MYSLLKYNHNQYKRIMVLVISWRQNLFIVSAWTDVSLRQTCNSDQIEMFSIVLYVCFGRYYFNFTSKRGFYRPLCYVGLPNQSVSCNHFPDITSEMSTFRDLFGRLLLLLPSDTDFQNLIWALRVSGCPIISWRIRLSLSRSTRPSFSAVFDLHCLQIGFVYFLPSY